MGIAIVRLNWTPAAFWAATPHEFFSAIEILQEAATRKEPAT